MSQLISIHGFTLLQVKRLSRNIGNASSIIFQKSTSSSSFGQFEFLNRLSSQSALTYIHITYASQHVMFKSINTLFWSRYCLNITLFIQPTTDSHIFLNCFPLSVNLKRFSMYSYSIPQCFVRLKCEKLLKQMNSFWLFKHKMCKKVMIIQI